MKKSTTIKQNLHNWNVIVQDTSVFSPNYFNLVDIPDKLAGGINSFWISVDNSNLIPNSDIFIEVLDLYGNPIYVEFQQVIDSANKRLISIYIYDDTPAGLALISIVGNAKTDLNGNDISTITNNIRWSKKIDVVPTDKSKSDIYFRKAPQLYVSEILNPITSGSYPVSGSLITLHGTNLNYYLVGNQPIIEIPINSYSFVPDMVGASVSFKLNSSTNSEPKVQSNRQFIFNTIIKEVLSFNKIILRDPIIINTTKYSSQQSSIWNPNDSGGVKITQLGGQDPNIDSI